MYDLLANASFVERATALQWTFTGDAFAILHYVVGDHDAFVARVEDVPQVLDFETVRADDRSFYAYVQDATTESLRDLFGPVTGRPLLVVPPVEYNPDGTVSFSLFGPDEALQDALDAVPDPVDVTIERIGGLDRLAATVETRLSERQRDAVEAALSLGYYEVPRDVTHEAVAEALNCAPSTAAEHLRKAESRVLHALFGD
jgi:hypothetical protein